MFLFYRGEILEINSISPVFRPVLLKVWEQSGVGFKIGRVGSGCRVSGLNLELDSRVSGCRDRIERKK